MPSPSYYAQNKSHTNKWRQSNISDKHRAINRKYKQKRDAWKKIQKQSSYSHILLH